MDLENIEAVYTEILKAAATATSGREVGRYISIARILLVSSGIRTRRQIAREVRQAAGPSMAVWLRGLNLNSPSSRWAHELARKATPKNNN